LRRLEKRPDGSVAAFVADERPGVEDDRHQAARSGSVTMA
jgi:hypothetical protein